MRRWEVKQIFKEYGGVVDWILTGVASRCFVLCCILLCCFALCCVVLHCVALCCVALYCVALFCVVLYFVVLFCIVLRCVALCCVVLLCVVMNAIMKRRVLQIAGNFLTGSGTISLSRRIPLRGFSRLVSCNIKYSLHIEMKRSRQTVCS